MTNHINSLLTVNQSIAKALFASSDSAYLKELLPFSVGSPILMSITHLLSHNEGQTPQQHYRRYQPSDTRH
jgi:hypothetical protein